MHNVASAVGSMWGSGVKHRSSTETGVESTELDPTVVIELGSIAAAVYSTRKSE